MNGAMIFETDLSNVNLENAKLDCALCDSSILRSLFNHKSIAIEYEYEKTRMNTIQKQDVFRIRKEG